VKRFLNCAVSTGVEWPKADTAFSFGTWEIIAFAPTQQHDASLHIDVAAHHLTLASGLSVLNQLLSIAAWLDDIYAVPLYGLLGTTEPNRQTRQTREFPTSILQGWCNSWKPVEDERKRTALAIYREAVNMARFHSLPFAVVGFYRVLEVTWPDGKLRGARMEEYLNEILAGDTVWLWLLQNGAYDGEATGKAVATYLFEECRHAAVHASGKKNRTIINPDDGIDQYRMRAAVSILKKLADEAMQHDLGISRNRWDQDASRTRAVNTRFP
jgi:hypothetical protein